MIPKTLHFIWIGQHLPDWAGANIEQFRKLNPDYEVKIHGEECILPEYQDAYKALPLVESRSDLLRYSVLQREGGWYFDCDFWPLRPISDIVSAYALRKSDFFLTEQHFQSDPIWTVANGVIGACAEHPVWHRINAFIKHSELPYTRVTFGPSMFAQLVWQLRGDDLFRFGRWPWFYPLDQKTACGAYLQLKRGDSPLEVLGPALRPTSDQLPFVLHLWQHGSQNLGRKRASPGIVTKAVAVTESLKGRRIGLVADNRQWEDGTQPFRAVHDGLVRLGCRVEHCVPGKWPIFTGAPELVVLWNGKKQLYSSIVLGAQSIQLPILYMEHGFYSRRAHTQLDHYGFAHRVSWADCLKAPAPADGEERFRRVWGSCPAKMKPRKHGYVLILLQVPNDAQLEDSQIATPGPLVQTAETAVPDGVDIRVRCHPRNEWGCGSQGRARMLPKGQTLKEAVQGARFVLTINSNAGNEAMAWGCPVLCLGPALYERVGVAKQSDVLGLPRAVGEMLAGWCPKTADVANYLYWLACRQWSRAELANGAVLAPLVEAAMGR